MVSILPSRATAPVLLRRCRRRPRRCPRRCSRRPCAPAAACRRTARHALLRAAPALLACSHSALLARAPTGPLALLARSPRLQAGEPATDLDGDYLEVRCCRLRCPALERHACWLLARPARRGA
jgi:hypothetical protein